MAALYQQARCENSQHRAQQTDVEWGSRASGSVLRCSKRLLVAFGSAPAEGRPRRVCTARVTFHWRTERAQRAPPVTRARRATAALHWKTGKSPDTALRG